MDVFVFICGIFSILASLVLIGFGITWFVGKNSKVTKKIGKLGSIISGSILALFLMAFLIGTGVIAHNEAVEKAQEAKMDKNFEKAVKTFNNNYYDTANKAEDIGNNIQEAWGDGIDNSVSADDFDVDSTIEDATMDNIVDITTVRLKTEKIGKAVKTMEKNDTGSYDFKAYKKAYEKLQAFTTLVCSPSGSYNSFNEEFSDLDTETANLYKSLIE